MIFEEPIGIIELGNEKIDCLIFIINKNSETEILSTSTVRTEGIHNGIVINLIKATNVIRTCISLAEKKAEVTLKKINVILEQPDFLCTKFSKAKRIDGSKIHKDDIDFLLREAKKQVTYNDEKHSIIHIFNHNYVVDGKTFNEEPIGVYAKNLSHEMSFITMPKNNIKNIVQSFIDCDIEVERFISCTFATAANLLNNNDLKSGSILIDLGFEKTCLGLFKNLALVNSITFPIGTNNIIKDISKVCSLSIKESVDISNQIDFSFKNNNKLFDNNSYLKDSYFSDSGFRKISKSLIQNVVKSRIDEILEKINKQVELTGFKKDKGAKLFIVGEGSDLSNLINYCSEFFGSEVIKLEQNNKTKIKQDSKERFTACLGALKIIRDGWETEAIPSKANKNQQKNGFFTRIFGIRS